MSLLIDQCGSVWDEHSGRLRLHFNAPISSHALPSFLIRNVGYVGVKVDGDTALVKAAPAHVSYRAFSVAVEMLEQRPMRRVALQWFDGKWHDEIFFGPQAGAAKKRLLELMLQRRQNGRHYTSSPRELDTLSELHHLHRLFAFWRSVQGKIDPEANEAELYEITGGKFLTIRQMGNGQLSFSSIGKGLITYRDSSWAVQFAGGPVEEQPDYSFGLWIVAGYLEAFARNLPDVSDFDTIVHDARNGNSQHHSYTRLLLPIETKTGEIQLLSAPRADRSIDLGLEALKKIG